VLVTHRFGKALAVQAMRRSDMVSAVPVMRRSP
jgi:hypothetical protein